MAIAVFVFVGSLGNGIDASVSGSIWSSDLLYSLADGLPLLNATDVAAIAGDITLARISEPRGIIVGAYHKTYRTIAFAVLVIAGSSVVTACFCTDYVLDSRQNAVDEPERE